MRLIFAGPETMTLGNRCAIGAVLAVLGFAPGCGRSAESSSPGSVPVETVAWETTAELRVRSAAMEPTLHCANGYGVGCEGEAADKLLVRGPVRTIKRAEIVAFRTPKLATQECGAGGVFVMRVIGLPDDVWELRNGFSYINGHKLEEPYVQPKSRDSQTLRLADIPPRDTYTRIPSGHYLLMGDNRSSSCDSRRWGVVPRTRMIGTVVRILRPKP